MRTPFVEYVLEALITAGVLARSHSLVAVCAGSAEQDVFVRLGFTNAVISNLDDRMEAGQFAPLKWSYQDAQEMSFEDESFEWAFVADGLHHVPAPHRALLEMYRVARRGIIVIESRHSLTMRVANLLGLSPEYELEAVVDNDFRYGGLNNTQIPNHIYRWTEEEFIKTIKSYNPLGEHTFRFFYALNLPYGQAEMKKSSVKLRVVQVSEPILRGVTRLFKKQCNSFAMVALKPRLPEDLWPWLTMANGEVVFNRAYARERFKTRSATAR
jgi:SAM-dependent methyltransferase